MGFEMSSKSLLSIEEKRSKIRGNYETIQVLKDRLEESKTKQRVGMNRAAYIKMILSVTTKVDKQNDELSQVIQETRRLQRDISNLNGRLERSFSVVRETILKDNKNDGWSDECYKLLNTMNECCDQLIKALQDTGEVIREMRQLEDQIGQMKVSIPVPDC